jgi:hypothetical protein
MPRSTMLSYEPSRRPGLFRNQSNAERDPATPSQSLAGNVTTMHNDGAMQAPIVVADAASYPP